MKNIVFIILIGIIHVGCFRSNVPVVENISVDDTNYSAHVKTIIKNHCYSCHSGQFPKRGIDLTTYEAVRFQAEEGNLLSRINNETKSMPPMGLMSRNERSTIINWVKNNYLEK